MSEAAIDDRLDVLHSALVFSREISGTLSVGERIVVNQERGRLQSIRFGHAVEPLPVPAHIESKIIEIQRLIERYKWQPQDKFPYSNNEDF